MSKANCVLSQQSTGISTEWNYCTTAPYCSSQIPKGMEVKKYTSCARVVIRVLLRALNKALSLFLSKLDIMIPRSAKSLPLKTLKMLRTDFKIGVLWRENIAEWTCQMYILKNNRYCDWLVQYRNNILTLSSS